MGGRVGSGRSKPADHVALLRGINVGGNNPVPMVALAELFERAGCHRVRTYIQSGNVLFRADRALAAAIPTRIQDALARRLGIEVPVITRTAEQLRAVVRDNPLAADGLDPARLHVAFLAAPPPADRVASLDPDRSPPDRFAVRGREIYLHCPNGMARTKLSGAYFDRQLATVSTVRNWNTVRKLLAMIEASDGW